MQFLILEVGKTETENVYCSGKVKVTYCYYILWISNLWIWF